MLTAGNLAVFPIQHLAPATVPEVKAISESELAERLAWRVPRLELSATPLRDAVPLFNRYSRIQLVLADSALGALRISGVVRADNVIALLQMLEEEHGVAAMPRGESEILLARRR